jgi:hypothetical protein
VRMPVKRGEFIKEFVFEEEFNVHFIVWE